MIRKRAQGVVGAVVDLSFHQPFGLVQGLLLQAQIWAKSDTLASRHAFQLFRDCGRSQEITQSVLAAFLVLALVKGP